MLQIPSRISQKNVFVHISENWSKNFWAYCFRDSSVRVFRYCFGNFSRICFVKSARESFRNSPGYFFLFRKLVHRFRLEFSNKSLCFSPESILRIFSNIFQNFTQRQSLKFLLLMSLINLNFENSTLKDQNN